MWEKKEKTPILALTATVIFIIWMVWRSESFEGLLSDLSSGFLNGFLMFSFVGLLGLVVYFVSGKNIFNDKDDEI